jgi:predicted aspartyl protease
MTPAYLSAYEPPFPTLKATIRFEDERTESLSALLDSGADASLVPVALLDQLGAFESEQATLRTHLGETLPVQLYLVNIEIDHHILPGVYVVADDIGEDIILGRDVLNKLPLFLDGPHQHTDILDDSTVQRLRARRESGG